jgi:threonine dehydrogenase-like Zn-dependent dehydrogenase
MKALTFRGKHHIQYESIPDPEILLPTDVIVKVKICALCGSDLHVYHEHEKGIDHGCAMGHEFTGEVVAIGKEVRSLRLGDLVMSPFTTSCGNCFYCKIGLTARCVHSQLFGWRENNQGLHGGQAEYVRVPLADSSLMKIPEGVTLEEGLMLGDILSTGFFCAKQAEIKPNNTYVVIGCGPVGLMAILGAREYGAEKIYAIDTLPERLAKAKEFGATVINASQQNSIKVIKEATEGRGADAALEAVGSSTTNRLAYDIIRPGGIISAVGVCTDSYLPFSPTDAYNKNITYKVGRCPARYMMEQLVPVVQKKKYNFTSIITHRMHLSEGVRGYDIFANKKDNCLKVVLTVD